MSQVPIQSYNQGKTLRRFETATSPRLERLKPGIGSRGGIETTGHERLTGLFADHALNVANSGFDLGLK